LGLLHCVFVLGLYNEDLSNEDQRKENAIIADNKWLKSNKKLSYS